MRGEKQGTARGKEDKAVTFSLWRLISREHGKELPRCEGGDGVYEKEENEGKSVCATVSGEGGCSVMLHGVGEKRNHSDDSDS